MIYAQLNIGKGCNSKCLLCNNWNDEKTSADIFTLKKIVDKLAIGNVDTIKLWGGEPLIKENIIELIKYINQKQIKIILPTNGILVNEKLISEIKDLVDTYQISVDSLDKITFRHLRGHDITPTLNAIELIKKNSPRSKIIINTIITNSNLNEIEYMTDYFLKKGVSGINLIKVLDFNKNYDSKKLSKEDETRLNLEILPSIIQKIKNTDLKLILNYKPLFEIDKPNKKVKKIHVISNGDIGFTQDYKNISLGNILSDDLNKIMNSNLVKLIDKYNEKFRLVKKKNEFLLIVKYKLLKINVKKIEFIKIKINPLCSPKKIYFILKKDITLDEFIDFLNTNKFNINISSSKNNKLTTKSLIAHNLIPIDLNEFSFSKLNDFIGLLKEYNNLLKKKTKKLSLMIEPTNKCNLKCTTCFSHLDNREKIDMSFENFKRIIDENSEQIDSLSLYNYGEPLLNEEISKMVSYSKENNIKFVKIASNGMKLTNKNISSLIASNLDYLSISLDGATKETYSKFRIGGDFDLIIKNIKNLIKYRDNANSNMKVELQFIIMNHNEHEIKDIEKLSIKLGVDFLRLKKVLIKKNKWGFLLPKDTNYSRYGQKSFSTCNKPLNELTINSNGNVIPCCYVVENDINKYKLGNVFETNINKILDSKKYKEFLNNCLTNKTLNSPCANCDEGNLEIDYKLIKLK